LKGRGGIEQRVRRDKGIERKRGRGVKSREGEKEERDGKAEEV